MCSAQRPSFRRRLAICTSIVRSVVRKDAPAMRRQQRKYAELSRRQLQLFAVERGGVPLFAEAQAVEVGIRRNYRAAPQHGTDARDQHLAVKRLRHIVVRAALKAAHDVLALGAGGEHHYARTGQCGRLAYAAADREAVDSGQHHVEKNEIRLAAADCRKPFVAARAACHLGEPLGGKVHLEDRADYGVVLDHDDGRQLVHDASAMSFFIARASDLPISPVSMWYLTVLPVLR